MSALKKKGNLKFCSKQNKSVICDGFYSHRELISAIRRAENRNYQKVIVCYLAVSEIGNPVGFFFETWKGLSAT